MIGTNLYPDDTSFKALTIAVQNMPGFKHLRLWIDCKPQNPSPNASIQEMEKAWMNAEKICGGSCGNMSKYCLEKGVSIIYTLTPPDSWIPKRELKDVNAFTKLWISFISVGVKSGWIRDHVYLELSNEPAGDWTMKISPDNYLCVVKNVLKEMQMFPNLTPHILVAGHHCLTNLDPYTKLILKKLPNHPNISYSIHTYEGDDSEKRQITSQSANSKNIFSSRLASYTSSLPSPPIATEIATHLMSVSQSHTLAFALLTTQNALLSLRHGFKATLQWLGRDYDWQSEKWGWLDEKLQPKHSWFTWSILGIEPILSKISQPNDTDQSLVSTLQAITPKGHRIWLINRDIQPRTCLLTNLSSTLLEISSYPPNLSITPSPPNSLLVPPQSIFTLLYSKSIQ